jgi:dTDP-4-amino-4,6-dideoxygalactose transaminase
MVQIMDIAKRKNIPVIEDNAQAHGSMIGRRRTGSFGLINAHSFYPSKNLGALGDGGAITTNDRQLSERIRVMRNYGGLQKGIAEEKGINSRLDEMQAAVLTVKLRKLAAWNKERLRLAALYKKGLAGVGDISLPVTIKGTTPVHHLFVIRLSRRDALKAYLAQKKVGTMIHYPVPPHLQPAFADKFQSGQFPIAEKISGTCLSLPLWPGMSASEVDRVVSVIRDFFV